MKFPADRLPPDVIKSLAEGRRIDAIKLLRKSMKIGLAEAKALIDAHARGIGDSPSFGDAHAKHETDDTGGHIFTPRSGGAPAFAPTPTIRSSGLAPGEVKQSNAAAWAVALILALLVAYYVFGGP
jgi:hypothetical protein